MKMLRLVFRCVVAILAVSSGTSGIGASPFYPVYARERSFSWNSQCPTGIAGDGTNFLVAGVGAGGEIVVSKISRELPTPSATVSLGITGGPPQIAFAGNRYLVIWPDRSQPFGGILGQFVSQEAAPMGQPFQLSGGMHVNDGCALAFDGTHYLVVWEIQAGVGDGDGTSTIILGKLIAADGATLSEQLPIATGPSPQRHPAIAWNGSAYLVTWTAQASESNSWNIVGRKINPDGLLSAPSIISQVPAQNAWPPAVASDGTNWLVVWTRERGPFAVGTSKVSIPALFGRLVTPITTFTGDEIEIRWGRFGQYDPAVTFDGANYGIAWLDRATELSLQGVFAMEYSAYFQQLAPSGIAVGTEWAVTAAANRRSRVVLSSGTAAFVGAWSGDSVTSTRGMMLVPLLNEKTPVITSCKVMSNGDTQLTLDCRSPAAIGFQSSSNLVDWADLGILEMKPIDAVCRSQYTIASSRAGIGEQRYFRAWNGRDICIENLRRIRQATEHWALENNQPLSVVPLLTDLVGPGKYLSSLPTCPHFGAYVFPGTYDLPRCSLSVSSGHSY